MHCDWTPYYGVLTRKKVLDEINPTNDSLNKKIYTLIC